MHPRFSLITFLAATAASAAVTDPAPAPVGLASVLAPGPALDARQDPPPPPNPTPPNPNPSPPNPSDPNPSPPNPSAPNPSAPNPSAPNPSAPNPSAPNPSAPNPSAPNPSAPNPSPPNPTPPHPPTGMPTLPPLSRPPISLHSLPTSCSTSLSSIISALPTPATTAHTDLPEWASSSAPIQQVLAVVTANYAYQSLGRDAVDWCGAAAAVVTPPASLSAAYAQYLDQVQSWRYDFEGRAYELAEKCGYQVGLAAEMLMATEMAMCTSGLAASVEPWKTAGVGEGLGGGSRGDGDGENAAGRVAGAGRAVAVGAVVIGGVLAFL